MSYEELPDDAKAFVDAQADEKGVPREEIIAAFEDAYAGRKTKKRGLLV